MARCQHGCSRLENVLSFNPDLDTVGLLAERRDVARDDPEAAFRPLY